ncbi:hypothetical protein KFK09_001388 [Dendrobium nobile]|uniref:DUF4216 domain-containing protein n=1 Tax=Dendrobium nobile TaxID=94219 RepID=A0A8T3CAQ9_DENNO|nr:hypothetical protein KFK09_001388 [Dendrobium nobile]
MGPDIRVNVYSGCIVNGVKFLVNQRDIRRVTQNSGVSVQGSHKDESIDFYGVLTDVVDLSYIDGNHVVLFKCKWFDLEHKKPIVIDDDFTSINMSKTCLLSHGSRKADKLSNNSNYSHLFAPSTSNNVQSSLKNDASHVVSTLNNGGLPIGEASPIADRPSLPHSSAPETEKTIIASSSNKKRGPNRGVALEEHYRTKDKSPYLSLSQHAKCSQSRKTTTSFRIELYKEEFTDKENKWVSEDCEDKMMEIREKIIDDGGIVDETIICAEVLGETSSYIRGLGYGPKPIKKTKIVRSNASTEREIELETSLKVIQDKYEEQNEAIQFFSEMRLSGLEPDDITIRCLLCAICDCFEYLALCSFVLSSGTPLLSRGCYYVFVVPLFVGCPLSCFVPSRTVVLIYSWVIYLLAAWGHLATLYIGMEYMRTHNFKLAEQAWANRPTNIGRMMRNSTSTDGNGHAELFMALQPEITTCGNKAKTFTMRVRFLVGKAIIVTTFIADDIRNVQL